MPANVARYGASSSASAATNVAAFTNAIAAAQLADGVVLVPQGYYAWTGSLTVEGVTLLGSGVYSRTDPTLGSTIKVTDTSNPPIILETGASVVGMNFWWPNQVTSASPTVYPPAIQLDVTDGALPVRIEDCTFFNAYIAIDVNGDIGQGSPIVTIRNNQICAISIGIDHPFSLVETLITGNRMSYIWWAASVGQDIRDTISSEATAIKVGDTDGAVIQGNTIFGWNKGVHCDDTQSYTYIQNNMFDGCYYGIHIDDANVGPVITGNQFIAIDNNDTGRTDARCIFYELTSANLSSSSVIDGNLFGSTNGDHIRISVASSTNNTHDFVISDNHFSNAGRHDTVNTHYGVYAVDANGGQISLTVSGNRFIDSANQTSGKVIGVYADCSEVVVSNNRFRFMDKSVDLSGMTASTQRGLITGNISKSPNTGDYFFPAAQGRVFGVGNMAHDGGTGTGTSIVASAATVTLPNSDYPYYTVTGTTGITDITASWIGRRVVLVFEDVLTLTSNSGNLRLDGNYTTEAYASLGLVSDGTHWIETSRGR